MIKEKKKKTKYNIKKSKKEILIEYFRTIGISVLCAVIFTGYLAFHARNEMIKDISSTSQNQQMLDKKVAQQIIAQANWLDNLSTKTYSVCMQAGEIYEIAGDYEHAQSAYEQAVHKAKKATYKPYYKLLCVLVAQEKFSLAEAMLDNIVDHTSIPLVKFKTRSYLTIGDKYYSIGKFLSAAKAYENADFYYDKFKKKDKAVETSINNRIVNAYINVADIMVKSGQNSDAIRFLKKAEKYLPNDFQIKYKLAVVYSDTDPEKSVKYIEELLDERPQDIDYNLYGSALMKAANIADLDGRPTQAKYYRYKIHSIDLFIKRKIIYKNDIEVSLANFDIRKKMFTYPIKAELSFLNVSNNDVVNLKGDFVLINNKKPVETITKVVANKDTPLLAYSYQGNTIPVKFKKTVFTKKELENYSIRVYLYKDEKFKTPVKEIRVQTRNKSVLDLPTF